MPQEFHIGHRSALVSWLGRVSTALGAVLGRTPGVRLVSPVPRPRTATRRSPGRTG